MAFTLSIYPWMYSAQYNGAGWDEKYIEGKHLSAAEESAMDEESHAELTASRNHIPGMPLVNYTTQYGLGCFEGLKAFPQPDGSLKLFRPDRNCARMAASMRGLRMPMIEENRLLNAIIETVRRNHEIGFTPPYNAAWEDDFWASADAVYVRPFTHAEPGIGINLSYKPWVVVSCTTVSSYFLAGRNDAVTSKRIRATPNGTGWIKTAANYVTSILAKAEAIDDGYMESIFLDGLTRQYIEEGSSCNFFALFPGGKLITPVLHDTILPGITRESVIVLAREIGLKVEESDLPVAKVLEDAKECFVTGTAAGVTPLESITHEGVKKTFSSLQDNSVSNTLLKKLKSIQYGFSADTHGWMVEVTSV